MKYIITVLLATLVLTGCTSTTTRYGAPGGEAGAGGEWAVGGAGGASGAAGSAGEPVAGAGGQAASGGGAGSAGASGGAGGAGGAQATCSAEEAFSTAAMPTSWIWDSFSWERDGKCISCAAAPCAEFQVSYDDLISPPVWEEPTLVKVLLDSEQLWLDANAGACGAETQCRYSVIVMPYVWLRLTPVAGGWEANVESTYNFPAFYSTAACNAGAPLQWSEAIRTTLTSVVEDAFSGLFFPCPS